MRPAVASGDDAPGARAGDSALAALVDDRVDLAAACSGRRSREPADVAAPANASGGGADRVDLAVVLLVVEAAARQDRLELDQVAAGSGPGALQRWPQLHAGQVPRAAQVVAVERPVVARVPLLGRRLRRGLGLRELHVGVRDVAG